MHIKINNTSKRPCVLREAAHMVNDLTHAEIAKHNTGKIYDPKKMNIEEQINAIDSELWAFLELATRSVSERKCSSNEERNAHIKKLRRFYSLCILMYCANSQKPTMLHFLLTDIVEICGGSRTLIKIIN